MSSISKMRIQGIRSFGPDNPQKIEFYSPVTLILGPNGTGKTTIIECLKYATTGEMPSGGKVGSSFIYDPKLAQEVEVKAKVALEFRDVSSELVIVSKILSATQKDPKKASTLKTLDSSMKFQKASGEVYSTSGKSADIEKEMVSRMGVSKAVLENVIFCHQEDSNWPLLEAKSVKQKFDDLFASARYVKALEAIRKAKLEQDSNNKTYSAELKHLKKNLDDAFRTREDKNSLEMKLDQKKTEMETVEAKLGPLVIEIDNNRKKFSEIVELQSNLNSLDAKRKELNEQLEVLESRITFKFEGTDEELHEKLNTGDEQLVEKQMSLKGVEQEIDEYQRSIQKCENEKSKLTIKKTELKMKQQEIKEIQAKRSDLIEAFFKKYGEDDCFEEGSIEKIDEILDQVNSDYESQKKNYSLIEKQLQSSVDSSREEMAKYNQNVENLKDRKRTLTGQLNVIKKKIEANSTIEQTISKLKSDLESAMQESESMKSDNDQELCKRETEFLKDEKQAVKGELEKIEKLITTYQSDMKNIQEFNVNDKSLKECQENMDKLLSKHTPSLVELLTKKDGDDKQDLPKAMDLSKELGSVINKIDRELKSVRSNVTLMNNQKSTLQSSVKNHLNRIEEYKQRQMEIEKRVREVTDDDLFVDIDELLLDLKVQRDLFEEKYVEDQGSLFLWKKFRETLQSSVKKTECVADAAGCPVCDRKFDDQVQMKKIIKKIDAIIINMPEQLSKYKTDVETNAKKYDSLLQIKPLSIENQEIEQTHLPQLEGELEKLQEESLKITKKLNQENSKVGLLESQEKLAKSISNDVTIISQLANQAAKFERDIEALKSVINPILLEKNDDIYERVDELIRQKDKMRKKLSEADEKIEEFSRRMESFRLKERKMNDRVHYLKSKLLESEKENQSMGKFMEDMEKFSKEIEENESLTKDLLHVSLPKIKEALKENVDKLEDSVKERNQSLNLIQSKLQDIRNTIRDIKKNEEVLTQKSRKANSEMSFEDIEQELGRLDNSIEEFNRLRNAKKADIEQTKSEISNFKLNQRNLEDCQELRKLNLKLNNLILNIRQEEEKFNKITNSSESDNEKPCTKRLDERIKRLSSDEERLRLEKMKISEVMTHFKAQISLLNKELTSKYASTERNYLETCYLQTSSQMTSTDLELFYKALDRAIMQHHANKMAEINTILKELWRNTYRGNDIDYIEIISEDDGTGLTKTRRTYNYRVVMVKIGSKDVATIAGRTNYDAKLDMRGRCSAGQKVLASLVIRLALAEVFCIQCGVLALDEPTTNLDRDNIESLACALVDIIKSRSSQRNFQLIIITHDEDFLELMGRSDFCEYFFELNRNENGLSIINKRRFDNHFH